DVALLRSDLAHPERRALPEVVILTFRDRDVELVLHPGLDRSEHAALPLEGMVLRQKQLEAQDADHHTGRSPDASGLTLGGLGSLTGLSALGAAVRESPRDLLDLVAFDDVSDLEVLEILEADAALVAARDLAHVLLEAPEAAHAPLVHDDVV